MEKDSEVDIGANYKDMKITQIMDTKGKRWRKTGGEIDRLLYAINEAIKQNIPGPKSGAWWTFVKDQMKVTRNAADIKSYFNRVVKSGKGEYGYSVLCKFDAQLSQQRSASSASRS